MPRQTDGVSRGSCGVWWSLRIWGSREIAARRTDIAPAHHSGTAFVEHADPNGLDLRGESSIQCIFEQSTLFSFVGFSLLTPCLINHSQRVCTLFMSRRALSYQLQRKEMLYMVEALVHLPWTFPKFHPFRGTEFSLSEKSCL